MCHVPEPGPQLSAQGGLFLLLRLFCFLLPHYFETNSGRDIISSETFQCSSLKGKSLSFEYSYGATAVTPGRSE